MLRDINEILKRLKNVTLKENFNGDRMLREIVSLLARQLELDEHGDVTHKEFDRVMKINTGPVNVMLMAALEQYNGIQIGGNESADREEHFQEEPGEMPEMPDKDFEPKPELEPDGGEDFKEIPRRGMPEKPSRRGAPKRDWPRPEEIA